MNTNLSNFSGAKVPTKYRRSSDKMIAGVCAAIARETGVDVGIIRIITAVAAVFTSGLVLVAYLIAWAVLPAEGSDKTFMDQAVREGQKLFDKNTGSKPWSPNSSSQPGPAPQTPQANRPGDPDPFDLYKD
ncbi:PspC domain-containing protein [Propionibacteriaceae bacterium G1746]|uniref:PspC domain-containing protein n=1 Tax=Aestuariimicrobium sp. G57 TaxID=3418485 RepID=UPI003C224409